MRRAHGCLRGPRPAPAVGGVSRRPREDALQHIALLAIDDAPTDHSFADLPEPRRGAALFAQEPQHWVSFNFQTSLFLFWAHRGAARGVRHGGRL